MHLKSCSIFISSSEDNFIFKLCYRWTVLLLVSFSFIVTCRLVFGHTFVCDTSSGMMSASYANVKCYALSLYTQPSELVKKNDGSPGVEPPNENYRRYQSYYPWVNLMFLVWSFNFYLPHLLWKSYEGGYIYKLISRIRNVSDNDEKRGMSDLARYVLVSQGKHKQYTSLYIFSEACNFIISMAQTLWLINFFDVTGVPDFLQLSLETWSDFKNFYFPLSGKCELSKPGASGAIMRYATMCEMPLNQLFMYMYLFLKAWFIFITILTGCVIVYRMALVVRSFRVFVTQSSALLAENSVINSMCYGMAYSDWFFLRRLQKKMIDVEFVQLLNKIAILSQGKDAQKANDKINLFEECMEDLDNSGATSPL